MKFVLAGLLILSVVATGCARFANQGSLACPVDYSVGGYVSFAGSDVTVESFILQLQADPHVRQGSSLILDVCGVSQRIERDGSRAVRIALASDVESHAELVSRVDALGLDVQFLSEGDVWLDCDGEPDCAVVGDQVDTFTIESD